MIKIEELNIIHYHVMSILQDEEVGWWNGYDNIHDILFDRINIQLSKRQVKSTLQDLKDVGYVYTASIFDVKMKLNGVGWFCKPQYRDTIFRLDDFKND